MTKPQFFTAPDGTEMAVVPRADYDALIAAAEDAEDAAAMAAGRASIAEEGGIPLDVSSAIADGIHPIAAWRKFRGLTQSALAARADVTQGAITRLESSPPGSGRPETLAAIADALDAPRWTLDGPAPTTPEAKLRRAISQQGDPKTGRILRSGKN